MKEIFLSSIDDIKINDVVYSRYVECKDITSPRFNFYKFVVTYIDANHKYVEATERNTGQLIRFTVTNYAIHNKKFVCSPAKTKYGRLLCPEYVQDFNLSNKI